MLWASLGLRRARESIYSVLMLLVTSDRSCFSRMVPQMPSLINSPLFVESKMYFQDSIDYVIHSPSFIVLIARTMVRTAALAH